MFTVIYSFEVKSDHEKEFIDVWTALTKMLHRYANSKGSRLHKASTGQFIAYANWPNERLWNTADRKLPPEHKELRNKLKNACTKIETIYTSELLVDLLQ